MIPISFLTYVGFELNAALDGGYGKGVTLEGVRRALERRQLFPYLESELGARTDLSMLDDALREAMTAEWADFAEAINAERKMGVRRNGLCLLIAFVLESVQRRSLAAFMPPQPPGDGKPGSN